jgi:SAM-dependent methyltransferase
VGAEDDAVRMVKSLIKRVLYRLGYQVLPAPNWDTTRDVVEHGTYRLVNWRKSDGQVDLTGYRHEQEKGNRAKIEQIWTNEANLRFVSQWLRDRGVGPNFILCHGTRNGFEQRVFSEFFGCEVVGTEISSTASQFPMTVQADFHENRPEWDARADIVYSNSLDHAYDPAKAVCAWAQSVKDGGVLLIEKASDSDPRGASNLDPFAITLPNLLVFVLESLGEIASIRALLEVPEIRVGANYHKMIVIVIDRRSMRPAGSRGT